MAAGHDGPSIAALALECLAGHPARLGENELRRRLVCTFGDGGVCKGGPQSKHSSTGAAELVYQAIHPLSPPLSIWGSFHRSDTAEKHAAEEIPLVGAFAGSCLHSQ